MSSAVIKFSIEGIEKQQIWGRIMMCLTSIGTQIKFVICEEYLSLSTLNSSKSTFSECIFKSSFFKEFSYNNNNNNKYHSFQVTSKFLVPLFKQIDHDKTIETITMIINNESLNETIKNHLIIKVLNKSRIKKQYNLFIQNCGFERPRVREMYKKQEEMRGKKKENIQDEHDNENEDEEDNIYTFEVENNIIKRFIEMIPLTIDDFRIRFTSKHIVMSGFSRIVNKPDKILKQPMELSVSMDNGEFQSVDAVEDACVCFRIKDFKVFINSICHISSKMKAFFHEAGDPVLFEVGDIDFEFGVVLITDVGERDRESPKPGHKPKPKSVITTVPPTESVVSETSASLKEQVEDAVGWDATGYPDTHATNSADGGESGDFDQLVLTYDDNDNTTAIGPTQPNDSARGLFD